MVWQARQTCGTAIERQRSDHSERQKEPTDNIQTLFSTLFQEWLATKEAKQTQKSFQNVFLVPYPRHDADITVELHDYHGNITATMTHSVCPEDILIRHLGEQDITPYITLQTAADTSKCIHISYVAEGYKKEEMDAFISDAKSATDALFAHEPFKAMRNRFHVT